MGKAKRVNKRPRPAKVLGDPTKRHPSNLGKQLMDAVSAYNKSCGKEGRLGHVARLCLRGLGDHADREGWCFPGSALLGSYCEATEKTVTRVLSELMRAGLVACIEASERRGKALAWGNAGAPLNVERLKKMPTARLYLLKTIATSEAFAWLDTAQRVIGRAPPENPVSSRWAIVSKGDREPLHLGKDIIEMVARRELDGSALVRASSMRDSIAVRDVPEFASAIPGPRQYVLDPIAPQSFSEQELARMVRGAGLRVTEATEAWFADLSGRVRLLELPLVAAAAAERRAILLSHENDTVRAAS